MAILEVTYMSVALNRNTTFHVVLPADRMNPACTEYLPAKPLRTLYLLHGLQDNSAGWLTSTRIKRWATLMDMAVVMPQGDNSYYVDRPEAKANYGAFIGKELVEMTRRMFPLSHRREDTFIGGLSMGGFGAVRNGLKYHETFGRIPLKRNINMTQEGSPQDFQEGGSALEVPLYMNTPAYPECWSPQSLFR